MIARLLQGLFRRTPTAVTAAEAQSATLYGPAVLLDVREPQEWRAGHAPQAEHIPLGQLESRLAELPRDRQIICVCRSGRRSALATQQLVARGYQAVNLTGGMTAWNAAGLPVATGKGAAPAASSNPVTPLQIFEGAPVPPTRATQVDPATVIDWLAADPDAVTVLDVRSPAEFETRHIAGSYNLPLELVGEHAEALAARLDRKVVLVCQSGVRADQAHQRLAGTGMDNLHILTAGVGGFAAAGGTVVEGRARWSMERQVRLVAGSLVLAGVLASRVAHPRAVLLAGGVGAGLTASALTDTCTMGRILSALPYNQSPRTDPRQLLDRLPGTKVPAPGQ